MTSEARFERSVVLPASIDESFRYHQRPGALRRLIPPWEPVTIEESDEGIEVGDRVTLSLRAAGVPVRWVAEHTALDPPHGFEDRQARGPFTLWRHEHLFEQCGNPASPATRMIDRIHYRLPLGRAGETLGSEMVRRRLAAMFTYRHQTTVEDLALFSRYSPQPLRIAVSGSHGLVGGQLMALLQVAGHTVFRLVRGTPANAHEIAPWSPEADPRALEGLDAVVHLAGKSIASGRWNERLKREIRDSRVGPTRQLCQRLAALDRPPRTLVCASASGFYGDRGDEWLDEAAPPGEGYLPSVSKQWEEACAPAAEAGVRVVHARLAMVLSPRGGALGQMLLPARLFGGSLGSGVQWWSWISIDDCIGALYHCLMTSELAGPVNVTSPEPVTNQEFARTLGKVLRRPALVPAPAMVLRAVLGEMADALLLASARLRPARLTETGYRFRHPTLEAALRHLLGR